MAQTAVAPAVGAGSQRGALLTDVSTRGLIESVLMQPVASVETAGWGFQNRKDLVTLASGERVVLQRYRSRADVEARVRTLRALAEPAAAAGIPIPRVRKADLGAEPPWILFAALPGVPVPEAGELGFDGPRFVEAARLMGELLAWFRGLPTASLEPEDLWADPHRLARGAAHWAEAGQALDRTERAEVARVAERMPRLFAGRPVTLAHGDFAPVNVLIDRGVVSGLLGFESVRLADPLFDVAWWAWAVRLASPRVLEAGWPHFLHAAGIDPNERDLGERVRVLQILRMLELLGGDSRLEGDVAEIVVARLKEMLRSSD